MYKASITEKPTNFIENLDDFFSDDYFKQLAFLDFSNPAPIYGPFQWFDYLAQESIKFKDSLNRTVEKYSVHLSPETVEILEQILNSNLISFLQLTPVVRDLDNKEGFKREYNFFADEGMVDMLRENTDLIIKLINEYNENSGAETKITITSELWRNDISPKVGSSRKAMPNKANSHGKN